MIRVWDRFVRIFHWSQALLIAAAWLLADAVKWLHEWAGYAVLALILVPAWVDQLIHQIDAD